MRKELVAHLDPKSPVSETFRTLRTNIQFMNSNRRLRSLLVTSTMPGEGKSWVASNLAVTFAQAGKKVALIDADMRKGRVYSIFGVEPRPGLSNYLSAYFDKQEEQNLSEYLKTTVIENLYVIPAGNIPPNPSELLVSTQMINLLEELKKVCDIIIIDGTPCELVTDSIILSRIVDSTVIVTAYKITKREALERVIKNIQNVGGNLAGVVLNRIPVSNKKYEEKYYYYGHENIGKDTQKTKNKHLDLPNQEEINKQKIMEVLNVEEQQNNITEETQKNNQGIQTEENINNINQEIPQQEIQQDAQQEQNQLENNEEKIIYLEKTNNILNQIKDYLSNEKKDLN